MKVYINGLHTASTKGYKTQDFLADLCREGHRELEHSGHKRVVVVEQHDKLLLGALLTKRDQSQFVTWATDPNTKLPVITVQKTDAGNPMADFNFFVIRNDSGYGLLSQYSGSGGVTMFGNLLRKVHAELATARAETIRAELVESGEDPESKVNQKALKSVTISALRMVSMMKDGQFSKEVQKLSKINRFDYVEPTINEPEYASVRKGIVRVGKSVSFKSDGIITKLRGFLTAYVTDNSIEEGRVFGNLANGSEYSVPIHPDVFCFQKYRYDDVVRGENFRFPGLKDSPLIGKMIGVINANAELFEPDE